MTISVIVHHKGLFYSVFSLYPCISVMQCFDSAVLSLMYKFGLVFAFYCYHGDNKCVTQGMLKSMFALKPIINSEEEMYMLKNR